MKKKKLLMTVIVLIIIMGLIIFQSHKPIEDSTDISLGFADELVKIFNLENYNIEKINFFIRKSSHFISYMLIGILFMNIFYQKKIKLKNGILLSLILSFLFASSDEIHQLFVKGRSGQISDVILDMGGVAFGILIYYLKIKLKNI